MGILKAFTKTSPCLSLRMGEESTPLPNSVSFDPNVIMGYVLEPFIGQDVEHAARTLAGAAVAFSASRISFRNSLLLTRACMENANMEGSLVLDNVLAGLELEVLKERDGPALREYLDVLERRKEGLHEILQQSAAMSLYLLNGHQMISDEGHRYSLTDHMRSNPRLEVTLPEDCETFGPATAHILWRTYTAVHPKGRVVTDGFTDEDFLTDFEID